MSISLEEHGYKGFSEVTSTELTSENTKTSELRLKFKATELRLGLPGSESPERVKVNDGYVGNDEFSGVNHAVKHMVSGAKRGFSVAINGASNNWVLLNNAGSQVTADNKVSMDGAPYLRKIDLKTYGSYVGLSSALEKMFCGFTMGQSGNKCLPCLDDHSEGKLINKLQRSEYVLTYEDKDGDWMLVGDVPWKMFIDTCRRLRIMKSSDAVGLASRSTDD
ncbi:hypothetical protein KSS87_010168 [Heliosperma pusillum]|nr:hypothetical protein KSS87_010168 [Heliosperma pusillum]